MTDPARITAPTWIKDMNDGFLEQQRLGTLPFAMSVLTLPGRRSGLPRHTPLTVLEHEGARYVLGGFPAADWIRNARAAGRGSLSADGRTEQVRVVEVDPADTRAIMRRWPEVTPSGVEMMRDAGVIRDTTPEAMEEVVGVCPVFRLDPDGPGQATR